jgi:hypothetical protein
MSRPKSDDKSFEGVSKMRFVIATVIAALTLPGFAQAADPKGACKTRNSQMYRFCMLNARSKQAKKACKADLKHNKGMCK